MVQSKSAQHTLVVVIGLLLFMVALTCASVPLYRMFCQKTGYGGTIQISERPSGRIENRFFRIQFNADVDPHLPWEFHPLQKEILVQAGIPALAFYKVRNKTNMPLIGIAAYNVTPDRAGLYFHKIECFCFNEQYIGPGAEYEMPVQFFIDAGVVDNTDLKDLDVITLSYKFYLSKNFVWKDLEKTNTSMNTQAR